MKLALHSPLPPQRSGIADYAAMLVPYLAGYFELDLFTADAAAAPPPPGAGRVFSYPEFPARANDYALNIYMIGNDVAYHRQIYQQALKNPGLVVLHELVLHHLVAGLTLGEKKRGAYFRELRFAHGWRAVREARRALRENRAGEFFFHYPLHRRLLSRSLGAVVHNRWMCERLGAAYPLPLAVIPHLVPPLAQGEREEARRRLGLPEIPLLVSLGHLTRAKRLVQIIDAFERLRQRGRRCRLALVGELKADFDLRDLLQRRGLAEEVSLTGYLPPEDFLDWIRAAELVLNLRHPTAGETSGTLLMAMNLGRPVAVSRVAQYDEIPDGCCVKIDLGPQEIPLLAGQLELLLADPALAAAIGRLGQSWVRREGEPQAVAARYAAFILRLLDKHRRWRPAAPRSFFRSGDRLAEQLFERGKETGLGDKPAPGGRLQRSWRDLRQRFSSIRFRAYRRWRRVFPGGEARQ